MEIGCRACIRGSLCPTPQVPYMSLVPNVVSDVVQTVWWYRAKELSLQRACICCSKCHNTPQSKSQRFRRRTLFTEVAWLVYLISQQTQSRHGKGVWSIQSGFSTNIIGLTAPGVLNPTVPLVCARLEGKERSMVCLVVTASAETKHFFPHRLLEALWPMSLVPAPQTPLVEDSWAGELKLLT